MSKAVGKASFIRLIVPAGQAKPVPPVGPALGQRGVKAIDFCKLFNAQTAAYNPGVPISVQIFVAADRTFKFTTKAPATSWLLRQAAGVEKGSSRAGDVVAGTVSLKHVYEIAKIKHNDPGFQGKTLKDVCARIVGQSRGMGIEVVP